MTNDKENFDNSNAQKNRAYLDEIFKDDNSFEENEEEMMRLAQSKVDDYLKRNQVKENLSQKFGEMALEESEKSSQLDLRPVAQKPTDAEIERMKAQFIMQRNQLIDEKK